MAGNNLSPRQKMIGMMYLVLTALLALNVSKQVLDAFSKINNGIVKTTKNFSISFHFSFSLLKFKAKEFIQYLKPVGFGPSGKTCPK